MHIYIYVYINIYVCIYAHISCTIYIHTHILYAYKRTHARADVASHMHIQYIKGA